VGANLGIWSYFMSRLAGREGRVIAFEPQPELISHLESLKATFDLHNLVVVNSALSTRKGKAFMSRKSPGAGGASLVTPTSEGPHKVEVEVTTLDGFLSAMPDVRIDLLKCDVEGHELNVFKGAEARLRSDQPALIFEHHKRHAERGEVFDFLVELGYDGFFLQVDPQDHNRLLPRRRGRWLHFTEWNLHPYMKPGMGYRNYVFLRKGEQPEGFQDVHRSGHR
jgi:FkbM family methyltransferase